MKKRITTKIIAGKYKGKLLELPSLDTTRSTKSIIKESFFNVIQFDIIDTVFIEAFGGSGSIGLEAISRGSKKAYFCEIDKKSYKTLVNNCRLIDENSTYPMMGDTFVQIPNILKSLQNSEDDIVLYIDPPFVYREDMEDIYTKSFAMVEGIENNNISLIVFEHMSSYSMPDTLGKFSIEKTKKFGKSSLSYYRC
jgi:16S rRNA (guanine966-N2)-methyltransferase